MIAYYSRCADSREKDYESDKDTGKYEDGFVTSREWWYPGRFAHCARHVGDPAVDVMYRLSSHAVDSKR
jgi:hypothetical protein